MKKWLTAIRAPFLTASVIPVFVGIALAVYEVGAFNLLTGLLTLLGAVCLHIGTNLSNDYYDHITNDDEINETPTPFSGGSRVIQEKLISPKRMLTAALISFGIGIVIGLYIWSITPGNIVLYFGLIGFLSGFLYTATPFKLGYRGWGELLVGLNFGLLEVIGSYYVQTGHISTSAVLAGIPVSLLITAVLYINQFPDYEADKAVGKNHWVVRLGKEKARIIYYGLLYTSYLIVAIAVVIGVLTPWTLVVFITFPMALKASKVLKAHYSKIEELLPANAMTIQIHLTFGLLMVIGTLAGKFI